MRYSLTFHQLGLVENGLGDLPLPAALLLDYLNVSFFSCSKLKRITFEGEEFAWINLRTAAADLPMLVPSSLGEKAVIEKLSRWISCLRNFNLIATRRGERGRLHYRPTPLAASILISRSGNFILAENGKGDLPKTARRNGPGNIYEQYNMNIPPTPKGDETDFEAFWKTYPRKVKKPTALRSWKATRKDRPPIAQLLSSLASAISSDDWNQQNGKFIPHPASWLNAHQWDDFAAATTAATESAGQEPEGWRDIVAKNCPTYKCPETWGEVFPTIRDGVLDEIRKLKAA